MIECAVIGGGFAGLSAAVRLARAGVRVVLFEARPRCGGRAASYADAQSGIEIDNGQHLMMGCYRATLAHLRDIGAEAGVRRVPRLRIPFVHADGRRAELAMGALPYPVSIIQAFLSYRMLAAKERLGVLRVARAVKKLEPAALRALEGFTAADWLTSLRQGTGAIECLWRPMVLATMNADIVDASAKLFAVVLREIFLSGMDASAIVFPDRPLSLLHVDPAVRAILEHRGEVRAGTPVERIEQEDTGNFRLQLREGDDVRSRAVISALPPWSLTDVLGTADRDALGIDFDAYRPSEILSIHVWTGKEFTGAPMTGLLGTRLQWVFPKGRCPDGTIHTTCTISASHDLETNDAQLRELVLRELSALFAGFHPQDVRRMKFIRERRATFVPSPGMEAKRPPARTAIDGFFLAGDWTDTGLPATIESAVRSGWAAVREFLGGRGHHE